LNQLYRHGRTISEFYPLRQLPPGFSGKLSKECEIDLAAERVDARDSNAHVVAQAELAAVAAAFDDVFFFVIVVLCEESEAD
jgi:hypothetical protein